MEYDEDDIEDETGEQPSSSKKNKAAHLAPWQFKPGQSGNPSGRKAGESLKEFAKRYLACHTDEEKLEFMKGLNKHDIWKMAEGAPDNKTDFKNTGAPIILISNEIAKKYDPTSSPEQNSDVDSKV